MKIVKWVLIVIVILLFSVVVMFVVRGSKDDWIKNSKGVWIKHGNPQKIPDEVRIQQQMIETADRTYQEATVRGVDFSNGPCLGKINNDWVLDVAHDPRQPEDDKRQNQCSDYLSGSAKHFIEIDLNGKIIRIK